MRTMDGLERPKPLLKFSILIQSFLKLIQKCYDTETTNFASFSVKQTFSVLKAGEFFSTKIDENVPNNNYNFDILQDYSAYWLHRLYHYPYWYKRFHKIHHKYQQPTAFSAVAFHPLEVIFIQLTSIAPIFVVPVHWSTLKVKMVYNLSFKHASKLHLLPFFSCIRIIGI